MSFAHILILGAAAGLTIFLGLPIALLGRVGTKTKAVLTGIATGILLFLTIDILSKVLHAGEENLSSTGGLSGALLTLLLLACFAAGLLAIPMIEQRLRRRGSDRAPGAEDPSAGRPPSPLMLSLSIASGIGLHNFGEGLAIGQSAASGAVSLAVLLIVAFGLHNMTEGFGVAAPLAGAKPSVGFVVGAGLLAGGPTFLGTLVGSSWSSPVALVVFLSLAGGSLVYVTTELLAVGRANLPRLTQLSTVAAGFSVGFLTDLVVSLAGA